VKAVTAHHPNPKEIVMLKLAIASLLVLASSTALAQGGPPAATLSEQSGPLAVTGFYVAPTAGFTSFAGNTGYVAGLRGALMLNDKFGVGLAGNFIGTRHTRLSDDEVRDAGVYGGLYLQYVFSSTEMFHGYADTTIGGGSFCERGTGDHCDERDFAFVEPTLNLEINLTRNVRLAGGVGYRFAVAEDGPGLSSGDLSGTVARTSLIIGIF
jgi:hypothetical protein